MLAQDCPDADRLAAFYDGTLQIEQHLRIAQHLRDCVVCQVRSLADGKRIPEPRHFPTPQPHEWNQKPNTVNDTGVTETLTSIDQIGPYFIRRLIGRGGMGAVYEAIHNRLGKAVALKVLPRPVANDPEYLARFEREIRAIGKLDHPNVISATDAGDWNGVPYLAMDLVNGIDLAKLVRTLRSLDVTDACEIARQAAMGLAHAHGRGIIHRDVKPSNLIITHEGVVQVLDLGLAMFTTTLGIGDEQLTGPTILGTHDYMAPEQWSNAGSVTDRADVYGLGCVLYQLLAGQSPFSGAQFDSPNAKRRAHLALKVPPLGLHRADVPEKLSRLIESMLAKEADERPRMGEVAQLLSELITCVPKLTRLVERVKLAPTTGFNDGHPTAPAPVYSEVVDDLTTREFMSPAEPEPVSVGQPARPRSFLAVAILSLLVLSVVGVLAALMFGAFR